jgi:hypothetical protein
MEKLTEVRPPRSGRVKSQLDREEAALLVQLKQHPGWPVLLDVLESGCVVIETDLLRAKVGHPEIVLGAHAKAQAGWEVFEFFQRRINDVVMRHIEQEADGEEPTAEERLNAELKDVLG